MLRAKRYSVVLIDLLSSLRAMEPAIIVISSDDEDMDPGPLGPPLHSNVAALHLWWLIFNAASRLHETPSNNRRQGRRPLVAFRAYMRELDVLMREVIVADDSLRWKNDKLLCEVSHGRVFSICVSVSVCVGLSLFVSA